MIEYLENKGSKHLVKRDDKYAVIWIYNDYSIESPEYDNINIPQGSRISQGNGIGISEKDLISVAYWTSKKIALSRFGSSIKKTKLFHHLTSDEQNEFKIELNNLLKLNGLDERYYSNYGLNACTWLDPFSDFYNENYCSATEWFNLNKKNIENFLCKHEKHIHFG